MDEDKREEVKQAFNDPNDPVRILIGTDAAREGVNLQAQCSDMFHFDLPWNPGRMEQRNGRIDRMLQPDTQVRCHYFVYTQRPEDAVLEALVKKSVRIHEELGSLADVVEQRLALTLKNGISRKSAREMTRAIEATGPTLRPQAPRPRRRSWRPRGTRNSRRSSKSWASSRRRPATTSTSTPSGSVTW
jgi:SNF2 family DNA or RNA helicase